MKIAIEPGAYVVAVSGGVDSMVLLHLLTRQPGLRLVVAHFEHGIRTDSDEDRQLVSDVSGRYGLPFVFARGNLGAGVSEAVAREARYAFLQQVREEQGATAIITAHHQNDRIETALINLLRGTGLRGLSSLQSTDTVLRPLLTIPKEELLHYAKEQGLVWREDSTNADDRYLRNYIRHHIIGRLSDKQRNTLLQHIDTATDLRAALDQELAPYITGDSLDRSWFIQLPHVVSAEVLSAWLRQHGATFDRKGVERLVVFAKTAANDKRADVDRFFYIIVGKNHITLHPR